jgi:hypothetical protein
MIFPFSWPSLGQQTSQTTQAQCHEEATFDKRLPVEFELKTWENLERSGTLWGSIAIYWIFWILLGYQWDTVRILSCIAIGMKVGHGFLRDDSWWNLCGETKWHSVWWGLAGSWEILGLNEGDESWEKKEFDWGISRANCLSMERYPEKMVSLLYLDLVQKLGIPSGVSSSSPALEPPI